MGDTVRSDLASKALRNVSLEQDLERSIAAESMKHEMHLNRESHESTVCDSIRAESKIAIAKEAEQVAQYKEKTESLQLLCRNEEQYRESKIAELCKDMLVLRTRSDIVVVAQAKMASNLEFEHSKLQSSMELESTGLE